ncbi:virion structural protein [Bruynoghevirus LUZ24]|uniref:Phage particle protein n=2 Tax=root TaxID=1 RepID=A9J723_BPLUZ|nr:virion structural protein [Bruynoghevirus LUZ24]CAP45452.1 phage particle protein [Bruynoghevirus LUZ24]
MASMAYEGSPIRPSILRAAQNELDMARIARNKLPLAVEGSGIPDRVRRAAQAALENPDRWSRAAQEVAPAAEATGRGALGRIAGILGGPVSVGVQAAVTPGELGDAERTRAEEMAQASQAVENMGPEVAQEANQWAQGVGQRAAQNATGGPTGAGLLSYGVTPNQPSIEPEITPEVASEAGAAVADEEEANRQVIQQGAAEGLRTGAVSRPEMAQAVVEADAQREGVELKPQELKNRVNEELTQMRTMDNDDLSRYVSYALIGTGLLASALDKTGKAGDMFAASYERQLDRNLQAGINQDKMAAAAADRQIKEKDLERKVAKDAADVRLGEGNLKVKEGTLEQTKRKTEGVLDKWVNQAAVDRANLELTRRGQDLANQRAQLQAETTRRGQDMAQENAQLGSAVRLKTARISAQARQAAAKAARGEPVTTKDALGILSEVSGSQALGGKKLGKTAQQAIAQTLRNEMRANPGANPIGIIQREAAKLQPTGNWFFGGDLDYPAPTR